MVEAFSSSLDVCGMNPAVAKASIISILHQVSAFTLARISTGFLSPFLSLFQRRAMLVPSWAKLSEEEEFVFVHTFTQVATVSHALCSEIETGI